MQVPAFDFLFMSNSSVENAGLSLWYCYETKKSVLNRNYYGSISLSCFYKQNLALSILDNIYRRYKEEINNPLFRPLNTLSVCRMTVFAV